MTDRRIGWKAGILGWAALAGVTLLLHGLGRGALGPPPLSSAQRLATWWQQRGPVLATFAAAREAMWWIGCYLLTLGAATAVVCWRQSAGLVRTLRRCHLPGATTLIRASIGASALGASILAQAGPSFAASNDGSGGQGDAPPPAAPPVLSYAGEAGGVAGGGTAATLPGEAGGVPGGTAATPPVLRYVGTARRVAGTSTAAAPPVLRYAVQAGEGPGTTTAGVPSTAADRPFGSGGAPRPAPVPTRPASATVIRGTGQPSDDGAPPDLTVPGHSGPVLGSTSTGASGRQRATARSESVGRGRPSGGGVGVAGRWTVRPGDSLWSIAEATLSSASGRPPDAADLARYWWQIVQTNRPSLPVPADPDLLFPGDEVVVPPIPAGRPSS